MNHAGQGLSLCHFGVVSSAFAFWELFPASLSFELCVQSPPTQMGLEEGDTPVHGSRKRFQGTFENEEEVYKVAYVGAKLATNFKEQTH